MKFKLLMIAVLGMLCCSCSSVRHTSTVVDVDSKIVSFTVADVEISKEKASMTYKWNFNPFKPVSIDLAKTNTTAELLAQTGGDVLVEPQYIIEQRGFLRGGAVTVIGFPAKYTGFHTMTQDEAKIAGELISAKGPKNHKKKFLFF